MAAFRDSSFLTPGPGRAHGRAIVRRASPLLASEHARIALLLVIALVARLPFVLFTPGYDVRDYKVWARIVHEAGIGGAYSAEFPPGIPWINYPPLYLYVLRATGDLYLLLRPDGDWAGQMLAALLKLSPVLAELTIGLLLYRVVRRAAPARTALVWSGAFLLNPALIWNTAYWGGIDAFHALFLSAALFAAAAGRPERAGPLLALAVAAKPLAFPGALATVPAALRAGPRRCLTGIAAAFAVAMLLAIPLIVRGEAGALARAMLRNVGNQPAISANAHNLWWLVRWGDGWQYDTAQLVPGLDYRTAGFILFAAIAAWALAGLRAAGAGPIAVWSTGAFLTYAFFLVTTEVHENWSVALFAPLAAVAALRPAYRPLYVLLSVTTLANLALHDPPLRALFGSGFDPAARSLGIVNAALACAAFAWWSLLLVRVEAFPRCDPALTPNPSPRIGRGGAQ